jgi:hypothetical protein
MVQVLFVVGLLDSASFKASRAFFCKSCNRSRFCRTAHWPTLANATKVVVMYAHFIVCDTEKEEQRAGGHRVGRDCQLFKHGPPCRDSDHMHHVCKCQDEPGVSKDSALFILLIP